MLEYSEAQLPAQNQSAMTSTERRNDFSRLRSTSPIARGMLGPLVVSYDEIVKVLRDKRMRGPGMDLARASGVPEGCLLWQRQEQTLLFSQGEDHQRLRKLVSSAFTQRAVHELQDVASSVMRSLIDDVYEAGSVDAAVSWCKPYPGPVISALLGIDDWEDISEWAESLLLGLRLDAGEHLAEIEAAQVSLDSYIERAIKARRSQPRPDLLTRLIEARDAGDSLSQSELLSTVASLLIAGTDTTANQLSNMLLNFAQRPRAWSRLRKDPDLIGPAVEEAIRWEPSSELLIRFAIDDVTIGGYGVPAGTLVMLSSLSGNHDTDAMPGADRFDIQRERPEGWQLLTFGGGIHYCLGASLARMELTTALAELSARITDLHLDGEPVSNSPGSIVSGYSSLPLRWSP